MSTLFLTQFVLIRCQGTESITFLVNKQNSRLHLIHTVRFCCIIGKTVDVPPLYAVDATDTSEWETKVLTPASEVVSSLLQVSTTTTTFSEVPF